ncbi:hypothetical protein, partial [Vibrio cholerae]|uniref:hypothetical protein n=1 Tax=Vibrio cholerae TaxID=666 RepID=UPI001957CCFF
FSPVSGQGPAGSRVCFGKPLHHFDLLICFCEQLDHLDLLVCFGKRLHYFDLLVCFCELLHHLGVLDHTVGTQTKVLHELRL